MNRFTVEETIFGILTFFHHIDNIENILKIITNGCVEKCLNLEVFLLFFVY